jgi:hypothetical protein
MIVLAILIWTVAMALLPLAPNLVVVAVAIVLLGLSTGPFDIGLFTLRQRRTDPAWFGRAFAVSMSLNSVGNPIGSALWTAVAFALVSAVLPLVAIPAAEKEAA